MCSRSEEPEVALPRVAEITPNTAQLNEVLWEMRDRLYSFEDEDFDAALMHVSKAEAMALVVN